jgi:hypothetical protein
MSSNTIKQPETLEMESKSTLKRKATIAVPENNKFVIQIPGSLQLISVAQDILQEAEYIDGEEFTHLSYSAVTAGNNAIIQRTRRFRKGRV